jgi:hypothetical protein
MSFTSWPLGFTSTTIPSTSPFKYVNNIINSSSANSAFILATQGRATTTSIFNVPIGGTGNNLPPTGSYVVNDIISATYLNDTPTNQGSSFAEQSVIRLQNNQFALDALTTQGYSSFVSGLFNQFGLVSTIITSMIAYGNTDQLDIIGRDLVTQWPHQVYSNMLTINDAMTYIVRQLGTAADNSVNFANISEWRWMYPQRSRCVTPTTLNITSIITSTVTPANNIAYPTGLFRWDILRYDFFAENIYATANTRNTLLINSGDLLIDNDMFTLIYDNVAAPGCILLQLKLDLNYNDGTGSIDNKGVNTSRRVLNATYTGSNGTIFSTVFRVGFEWINDFIDTMSLCTPVVSPLTKALLYGGDLITSLQSIANSYLGCKRLYMWRLTHDLLIARLNNAGNGITPVNTVTNEGIIVSNSIPGVYLCLLNGTTIYEANLINIPQPLWQNFWYPLSVYDNSGTTLTCFTSVELLAYLTPTLSSEGIKPNKYGEILVLVNGELVPIQNLSSNQFSYTDPSLNTTSAITCYDSTNCWASFNPYIPPTNQPIFNQGNYILYIIIFIILLIFITIAIYYIVQHRKDQPEKDVKTVYSAPPIVVNS